MYENAVVQNFVDTWLGDVDEKVAREVIDGLRDVVTCLQGQSNPAREQTRKRYDQVKELPRTVKSKKPRICWRCKGEKKITFFKGKRATKVVCPTCSGTGNV
jgi:hypothetical protein